MSVVNGYATLAEFKSWKDITSTDTADDAVIDDIIEAASRYIDGETAKTFYPRVETQLYDYPDDTRELEMGDDLLEVISVTNGDDNAVSSSNYILLPNNYYPKYAIKIKESSTDYWELDSSGNTEQIIDVVAIWGYHERYGQRAWLLGSTVNEGAEFSNSDTTLTVTSGTLFAEDQIIRVGNELLRITGVSSNDLTVVRGENGSTAAAHDDATSIYIWQPEYDIRQTCLQIAHSYYKRRYGENESADSIITTGGVVITPRDVSGLSAKTLQRYRSWL